METEYPGIAQELHIPQTAQSDPSINQAVSQLMHFHVLACLKDGTTKEAIIDEVTPEGVILLVVEPLETDETERQGYGRPFYRRYNRFLFPFAWFVPPFFVPFPFFY
ncbi:MAG: hypothetical protein ABF608_04795 [Sporolactobacillus sp.]